MHPPTLCGAWARQVSRQPPPLLPGGYTVGEQVYFTGFSKTFESGYVLEHGKQGEVVGPGTTGEGVLVRFPGNKGEINCRLDHVRRGRRHAQPPQLPTTPAAPPLSPTHHTHYECRVWAHR